jgi:Uma2 family endonuclease
MATETMSATAIRPLTYDDLLQTPEGDVNRYEIIAGEMVVSASPSKRHAWISLRLVRLMADYVEEHKLGEVFHAPVDVRLGRHDIVVPDIIFLSEERKHLFGTQLVDGAPDMIVEVLSPSTRSRDLTAKLHLYAEAGVQEYWIVDQNSGEITVYWRSHNRSYEHLPADGTKACSRVIPGFELNSTKLIAGLD